jgi:hypothetical protein
MEAAIDSYERKDERLGRKPAGMVKLRIASPPGFTGHGADPASKTIAAQAIAQPKTIDSSYRLRYLLPSAKHES